MKSPEVIAPVSFPDRIHTLDFIRGFAVLGILIMNIQSFSMPEAAYLNPMAYGDMSGSNRWIWILSHVFADNKFISIFSMLFGAGIFLMSSKIESLSRKSAGFHYRRIFWLFVFGLIHAYLFWYGDILVAYAMCGVLVYLFRRIKAGWLLLFGFLTMFVGSALYLFFGATIEFWPPEQIESTKLFWMPALGEIQSEIEAYRGSWIEGFNQRYPMTMAMQTMVFLVNISWHTGGLMLIGMGLFKLGILSAERSNRFYFIGLILTGIIGYTLIYAGLRYNFSHQWAFEFSMYQGAQFNYWGSLFVAYAYICVIVLIFKSGALRWCTETLKLVGRSALSNYFFDTLVCTFLFYGYGFGFFAKVDRLGQILIVIVIWSVQIMLTRWWMKRYRFGPAEWLWRSLTYWKWQSLV